MRKIDKRINLVKANILAEQRYLQSKGITESFHGPDGTPIGVDSRHMPMTSGPQKTDGDIDELAIEIIKRANGDVTEENRLIVVTAAGNEDIQRRLTNRVSYLKSSSPIEEDLVNEIDYDRSLDINDFDFLNNGERIFSGWYVEPSGDEFLIKNKDFPFFEFAVFIGRGNRGSAKEYPWGYEARSTGGSNYPPHGHKGEYPIERNNARNIERVFKHFLIHNYDSIQRTSRH
jgi:hypothetical protein